MKIMIYNHDMIKKISSIGSVTVDSLPKGVGLERLRWNGKEIIDLTELTSIWIEYISGMFRLHCIKVPNSQLVKMQYKDRKKLWNDNGVYKIKTDEQIQTELNLQYRRSHYLQISDQMDILLKYLETKTDLTDELQDLINHWKSVKEKYPKVLNKIK